MFSVDPKERAECEAAWMKIITTKTKVMVLTRKWVDCTLSLLSVDLTVAFGASNLGERI